MLLFNDNRGVSPRCSTLRTVLFFRLLMLGYRHDRKHPDSNRNKTGFLPRTTCLVVSPVTRLVLGLDPHVLPGLKLCFRTCPFLNLFGTGISLTGTVVAHETQILGILHRHERESNPSVAGVKPAVHPGRQPLPVVSAEWPHPFLSYPVISGITPVEERVTGLEPVIPPWQGDV